ncbi:MAG: lysophospholipid acyltransferase family protein [Chitinophagia bacterium]|jgi:1-acyl-sn-glycerol-3-phosphate acyltransferase
MTNKIKLYTGRILAFWALFVFASTMFLFIWFYLACFFLQEPNKTKWHRTISRIWMGLFLTLSGLRFSVTGKHHFNKIGPAIVICNHNSLIDVPLSTPFLPRANKTIAKKSFIYVPIFGWIYQFGSVIVDRKNDHSRKTSFDNMKRVLDSGLDMLIYPEGTRNKTSEPLKSFYDGAFKLAVDTQKPIIPVVILNTKKILPAYPIMCFKPGKIQMDILAPINSQGHTVKSLKQLAFDTMSAHYKLHNPV